MSSREFAEAIHKFAWSRRVWRIDMQGTHSASGAHGDGVSCNYGAPDASAHISIAQDGTIRFGRDWNRAPAEAGLAMGPGVFTIEATGNFDHGRDRLEGAQWDSVIAAIDTVQRHFGLPVQALLFHRDLPHPDTTCPGSSIDKSEILAALSLRRPRQRAIPTDERSLAIGA